jgi:two-component system LytT family response regulator
MPIRTVIVEDEQYSRERLAKLLAAFEDVEIVAEAADGQSAVSIIDRAKPDVVFLDIQLPELSGFDVLEKATHRPAVVFVTAYDQYALRAFDENAIDYLLKPITKSLLARAIERVRSSRHPVDDRLVNLLREAVHGPRYPERLAVRQRGTILLVPTADIAWLGADDRYIVLHTADQEYLYDGTLNQLEAELDPARFCRIHRSVIVAQDRIEKIVCTSGGQYSVKIAGASGPSLAIGRAYLPQVRERLRF